MTIWILHQKLTQEEEQNILASTHLQLPFDGLPDLSRVSSSAQAMQLLRMLHPDEPPESIANRLDRFWGQFSGLHKEDLIAVPLKASGQVALATATSSYEYAVGDKGADIHRVPVTWYMRLIPLARFGKHKSVFSEGGSTMYEVTAQDTRVAIRDKLPHAYNRFAKWKWLLVIFMAMGLMQFVLPMLKH